MGRRLPVWWLLVPGMAPGAPRRNVLVLIAYLFALLVAASLAFGTF